MASKNETPWRLEDLVRQKLARRRRLAKLSFPEKIAILVRLQKMASGLGRHHRPAWPID